MTDHICEDRECSRLKDERITQLEIGVEKKMDKDGPEGAHNLFQRKLSWPMIITIILTVSGAAITTGYNVYSSEFKFAKKETVSSFKETTNVRLISVEKDIESINEKIIILSENFKETKEELSEEMRKNNEEQKQMLDDHSKHLEKLIKSFHRERNNGGS